MKKEVIPVMNEKILIIEDDEVISRFLNVAIKAKGDLPILAKNGITGINAVMNEVPSAILLDLGLPDIDGIEVIRQVRSFSAIPIIVVSARDKEREKVEALDLGADDYLTKPFSIGELMARIRVVLRKQKNMSEIGAIFTFHELMVDFEKRKVTLSEKEIHLTPIEFRLLSLLIEHQGKVLTHSFLQQAVWGYSSSDEYQTQRVFMASIRRKLEEEPAHARFIQTEIGVGYRFIDE
jgi:two-component system KDP operon response regulator KdpE